MKNCVSEGEIVDCTVNAIYNIPIGLMYVSDYGYAQILKVGHIV